MLLPIVPDGLNAVPGITCYTIEKYVLCFPPEGLAVAVGCRRGDSPVSKGEALTLQALASGGHLTAGSGHIYFLLPGRWAPAGNEI